jgi:hypothetical protein
MPDTGAYTRQFAIRTGESGVEKAKARPSRLVVRLRLPSLAGNVVGAQRSVCFGAIFRVPDMIIVTGFESSVLYFQIMDSPF